MKSPKEVRVEDVIDHVSTHGRLYGWFHTHHDQLLREFAIRRPNWTAIAEKLGDLGFVDGRGNRPSGATCRKVWWLVRKAKAAEAAVVTAAGAAVGRKFSPAPVLAPGEIAPGIRRVPEPHELIAPPPLVPIAVDQSGLDRPQMPKVNFRKQRSE